MRRRPAAAVQGGSSSSSTRQGRRRLAARRAQRRRQHRRRDQPRPHAVVEALPPGLAGGALVLAARARGEVVQLRRRDALERRVVLLLHEPHRLQRHRRPAPVGGGGRLERGGVVGLPRIVRVPGGGPLSPARGAVHARALARGRATHCVSGATSPTRGPTRDVVWAATDVDQPRVSRTGVCAGVTGAGGVAAAPAVATVRGPGCSVRDPRCCGKRSQRQRLSEGLPAVLVLKFDGCLELHALWLLCCVLRLSNALQSCVGIS
jgi:hypothetical protein